MRPKLLSRTFKNNFKLVKVCISWFVYAAGGFPQFHPHFSQPRVLIYARFVSVGSVFFSTEFDCFSLRLMASLKEFGCFSLKFMFFKKRDGFSLKLGVFYRMLMASR